MDTRVIIQVIIYGFIDSKGTHWVLDDLPVYANCRSDELNTGELSFITIQSSSLPIALDDAIPQ